MPPVGVIHGRYRSPIPAPRRLTTGGGLDRRRYHPESSGSHRSTLPPQREYRSACVLLQRHSAMTVHRITSRRVHAWCPLSYFEGLRTWSCRAALHTLEPPAYYTRLALRSNIRLRVVPRTLIVAGDSGIQAVGAWTMPDFNTPPAHAETAQACGYSWRGGTMHARKMLVSLLLACNT